MRAILIALLLAMVAVAGCTDDEPSNGDPASEPDADPAPETDNGAPEDDGGKPPANTEPQPEAGDENVTQENRAPQLRFTADVDAGQIPFDVTFSINGTDADNDTLQWRLAIGNEQVASESAVPGVYRHTFDTEGTYNATLVMTDGEASVNATIVITASVGEPVYDGPAPFVIAGSILLPAPICLGDGIGGDWHYFNDVIDNWGFILDGGAVEARFYDSDINNLGGAGTEGQVPAGTVEIDICSTGTSSAGYTFTAWHPDHPDHP